MTGSSDTDALLSRVGRRALIVALAATFVTALLPGAGVRAAAAVAGGAALSLTSFWAIRRSVTGLADAVLARSAGRAGRPRFLGLFVLRYALLVGMAYVMIARLHWSPLGLLCGASVTMLAAAAELIRRFRPS